MDSNTEPKLEPPGAGLPKGELLAARTLFWIMVKRGSREKFIGVFEGERKRIRQLLAGCDPERAGKRILIERLRGLEDSSRYWSVRMTLEHLRIVNEGIARIISQLAIDVPPEGKVSTAAVKPAADATGEGYENSCDAVVAAGMGAANLKTNLRYEHPWFGLLDAYEWLALAGGHMRIHREQIERIMEGAGRGNVTE